MLIHHPRSQVASEKAELSAALVEYEKDINLLESLYNDNKALLDQHNLDTDLKELAGYVGCCAPLVDGSDNAQNYTRARRMAQLDQSGLGQEETDRAEGTMEIWRPAREDDRVKHEDQ